MSKIQLRDFNSITHETDFILEVEAKYIIKIEEVSVFSDINLETQKSLTKITLKDGNTYLINENVFDVREKYESGITKTWKKGAKKKTYGKSNS